MALTNRERVAKGFDLLKDGLVPFAEREFHKHHGGYWIEHVAAGQRQGLGRNDDGSVRWDTQALLKVMIDNWQGVFRETLGHFERSLVGELLGHRNRWAHEEPFSSDDTHRMLDSAQRLLSAVSAASEATEVERLKFELQRVVFADQARQKARATEVVQGQPLVGLKPWREVVTPHPDVASGRYMQAEFAADLHNVHRGIGGEEYTNPREFFRRTFVTDGLRELLTGALRRLGGEGGDPVVELQTNFGGGKTHSMLALYHLFGSTPGGELPGVEQILREVGAERAPAARRAVLVGTHLSVGEVTRKADGTEVRTLWGEMAWQLGDSAGGRGPEAFGLVADSDRRGTPPGAEVLATLFNAYSPCLILIDEWVAYARNTFGEGPLPSGTFEAQATFAQALTEAAKGADRTLVVASIPSSDIEVGGELGRHALAVLKNVFERVGTPWRPASADEGFEIVRRRLFDDIEGRAAHSARDAVVQAFHRLYLDNKADFPAGSADGTYRRKIEAAYPIHPDVFDLLYGEWSTLDKFQRTRGVLRLLAKVIHRLWEANDLGLMIMPSSIPMDDPAVKSELTRYLDDPWEPIISSDVDGPSSLPLELDRGNPNLGRYSACRRVARTVYMGTAPGVAGKNPGVDDRRVRLGCTQPGENAATFGDALRRISDRAKYIHQDGNRYWISTKANLNRLAEDRANDYLRRVEELDAEVVRRIRTEHKQVASRGDFAGVHACPEGTGDVHDEPEARLVILAPSAAHRRRQEQSEARQTARKYLEQRGGSPRLNRNMLVFLAADGDRLSELRSATAYYLAWRSVFDEREALNLDAFQRRQAETKYKSYDDTVDIRIRETWVHALVPAHREPKPGEQLRPEDLVTLDEVRVGGNEALAKRTATKLRNDGSLMTELGGVPLRLHLDRHLWTETNHVSVEQLAEWFSRYLYLPRIVNRDVLHGAVRDGVMPLVIDHTFAVAAAYDAGKQRYVGLRLGGSAPPVVDNATLLVKPEIARGQTDVCPRCEAPTPDWDDVAKPCARCRYPEVVTKDACPACRAEAPSWDAERRQCSACDFGKESKPVCPRCGAAGPAWRAQSGECDGCGLGKPSPRKQPDLFVASVTLDGGRVGREAGRVAEEVLQHLSVLPGAEVEVRLELQVRVPGGVTDDVMRIVTENANTLKFDSHSFERE